jgi:chromosome segregation ATPase
MTENYFTTTDSDSEEPLVSNEIIALKKAITEKELALLEEKNQNLKAQMSYESVKKQLTDTHSQMQVYHSKINALEDQITERDALIIQQQV